MNSHLLQELRERIVDEAALVDLARRVEMFLTRVNNASPNTDATTTSDKASEEQDAQLKEIARMALMQMEHIYYRLDEVSRNLNKAQRFMEKFGNHTYLHPACLASKLEDRSSDPNRNDHPASLCGYPRVDESNYDPTAEIERCKGVVFKIGDKLSKIKALLCTVYFYAFHGEYEKARDMYLISHISEIIDNVDIPTKILYNRALVTLGISAFQLGYIQQAYDCLNNICTGRTKELLAQRVSNYSDFMSEEDRKAERRRQVPYHMHIDTDMLDCVHLTCAMLIELPLVVNTNDKIYSYSSKTYRKQLRMYNSKLFMGPPESVRDHVMAASNAVCEGKWKVACDLINGMEKWKAMPGGISVFESKVKGMLKLKIQSLALRVYMLRMASHYDSISVSHLCDLFDMDEKTCVTLISQLIFKKEVSGSWRSSGTVEEKGSQILILYNVQPSILQKAAKRVAEQLIALTDSNERLMYPLSGGIAGSPSLGKDDYAQDGRYPHRQYTYNGKGKDGWKGKPGRGVYGGRTQRKQQHGGKGYNAWATGKPGKK